MIKIGIKLKLLRQKNDLTIEELAERCELTKGYISQLERNLASPSIETLDNILTVLNTNLSDFFKTDKQTQVLFSSNDMNILDEENYQIKWLVHNSSSNDLEPILLTLYPYKQSEIIEASVGEIFGYVLEGKINVYYGDSKTIANKGDAFYIYCDKKHFLKNVTNKNAQILWISTPPKF